MSLGVLYLCDVVCDVSANGSLGVEGSIWVERGRRMGGGRQEIAREPVGGGERHSEGEYF